MQPKTGQCDRDLILLGGGHSHVLLLRHWKKQAAPNLRITLVSETALSPYSGMLPGFIAGHYSEADIHIELAQLCRACDVRWIEARAVGVDLENKQIILESRPPIGFDLLSIDTGSSPDKSIEGSQVHAVGVKPISKLCTHWQALQAAVAQRQSPAQIAVVGAGAAGVEIAFALQYRLGESAQIKLVFSAEAPLKGYPPGLVAKIERQCQKKNIELHSGCTVIKCEADGLICDDQTKILADYCWLCTPASAPAWIGASGFATDKRGFIAVNEYLQSTSHDFVFASGDVATVLDDPRPKAGVYAVRQAPYLAKNIQRYVGGKPLKPVRLQREFLSLLALGQKLAAGARFNVWFFGRWVWRWKNHIDQRFMRQFSDYAARVSQRPQMPCAACGSKISPKALETVLAQLQQRHPNQIDLQSAEDAAKLLIGEQRYWQSLDGFRAFDDDLYRVGYIAIIHALSDIYAMGQCAQHAMVWASVAYNRGRLQQRDLSAMMQGAAQALVDEDVRLCGGHSTEGPEALLAVSVGGLGVDAPWLKEGAKQGDVLVMSKAIGSGALLAAMMQNRLNAAHCQSLWANLSQSNKGLMLRARSAKVSSATDLTGFGLLGHLREMLGDGAIGLRLNLDAIALLPGFEAVVREGIQSTLSPALMRAADEVPGFAALNPLHRAMLCDPQTSGGLLLAMAEDQAEAWIEQGDCVVIGRFLRTANDAPIVFSTNT